MPRRRPIGGGLSLAWVADSTDGLNPSLVIVDEFHKHKTRDLIDVMETATGQRVKPLNFPITTALGLKED